MSDYLSAYIHDGYTAKGYIEGIERLYPAVRFTYRPILPKDRAVYVRAIQEAGNPRKEEEIAAAAIAKSVKSWNVKKTESAESQKLVDVPIKAAEILRLNVMVTNRIYRIVTGVEPSDSDPNSTDDSGKTDIDRMLDSTLNDESPEAADAGN